MKLVKYFEKAKAVSKLSDVKRVQIGCVAVYKKQVICCGWNQKKTNPLQMIFDNKYKEQYSNGFENKHELHAEMHLVRQLQGLNVPTKKIKLFIYREDKFGYLANCKPCISCYNALKSIGIQESNIYYTNSNGINNLLKGEIINEEF